MNFNTYDSHDRPGLHFQESSESYSDPLHWKPVWSQPSWLFRSALARTRRSARTQMDAAVILQSSGRNFWRRSRIYCYLAFAVRSLVDPGYFIDLVRSEPRFLSMPGYHSWLASGYRARSLSSSWKAGLSRNPMPPIRSRLCQYSRSDFSKRPRRCLRGTDHHLQASIWKLSPRLTHISCLGFGLPRQWLIDFASGKISSKSFSSLCLLPHYFIAVRQQNLVFFVFTNSNGLVHPRFLCLNLGSQAFHFKLILSYDQTRLELCIVIYCCHRFWADLFFSFLAWSPANCSRFYTFTWDWWWSRFPCQSHSLCRLILRVRL